MGPYYLPVQLPVDWWASVPGADDMGRQMTCDDLQHACWGRYHSGFRRQGGATLVAPDFCRADMRATFFEPGYLCTGNHSTIF